MLRFILSWHFTQENKEILGVSIFSKKKETFGQVGEYI